MDGAREPAGTARARVARALRASAHCAPTLPRSPAGGPHPICARRVTSTPGRGRRAFSASLAPRGPKPAPSRRPAGRRRPSLPRANSRTARPGGNPQADIALPQPAAS
ncbi:unnamed protein product [Rangifer tarandus platyrhynchus]|uniref:Uncharacterized protein n=2 Tax=Rangifer tarandus platyrhynchus TaxID=3082113 RepID=A0ABN8ZRR8_RANTA|nr:unnamed protein product [Rangifer tarandus platyrhynchus]